MDDMLLVMQQCFPLMDAPSIENTSTTCKILLPYRCGAPKKTIFKCSGCGKNIDQKNASSSSCTFHAGVSKTWLRTWEDSDPGIKFTEYTSYTCCGKDAGSEPCTRRRRHTSKLRCTRCGVYVAHAKDVSVLCKFHPSSGASLSETWKCCEKGSITSPGCQQEKGHVFAPLLRDVHTCVWSRLGTKAAIGTEDGLFLVSYNINSNTWSEHYFLPYHSVPLGVSSYNNATSRHVNSLDAVFSPDGSIAIINKSLVNMKSGSILTKIDAGHWSTFCPGWYSNNYFTYFATPTDSDHGVLALHAYDIAKKKMLPVANFTTSIPFDPTFNEPVRVRGAHLIPANKSVRFAHPDLKDFMSNWTGDKVTHILEPYGNRLLWISGTNITVLYKYEIENGRIQITVLKRLDEPLWRGIGNPCIAVQWIKDGFLALVYENAKGTASYKRHKYRVFHINDKLEILSKKKLPKEARIKGTGMFQDDEATLFHYSESEHKYYFALHSKFFIMNENLEIEFTMPWGSKADSGAQTWYNPYARMAMYSNQGKIAYLPPLGAPLSEDAVKLSNFEKERFIVSACKLEIK